MDAYPRSRTWPYVAVVVVIFAIAIAYPSEQKRRQKRNELPSRNRTWKQRKANPTPKVRYAKRPANPLAASRRVRIDFRPEWQIAQSRAEHRRQQQSLALVPMQAPVADRYIRRSDAAAHGISPSGLAPLGWDQLTVPSVLPQANDFIRMARRRVAVEPAPAFDHSAVPGTAQFPRRIREDIVIDIANQVEFDARSDTHVDSLAADGAALDSQPAAEHSISELDISATEGADIESALPDEMDAQATADVLTVASTPSKAWPNPTTLCRMLGELEPDVAQVAKWSRSVSAELEQLQNEVDLTPSACGKHFDRLSELTAAAAALEVHLAQPDRVLLRRIGYAINRRVAVWRAASAWSALDDDDTPDRIHVSETYGVLQAIDEQLSSHTHARAWRNYLMLDTLFKITTETWVAEPMTRRKTARRVLTRMDDPELSDEQRLVLLQPACLQLREHLGRWAAPSHDAAELLQIIEQFESTRSAVVAERLADQMNSLAYSSHPAAARLRSELNTHYRNANIRLTLTGELLNDLLPVLKPIEQRIRDTILGAAVTGRNQTSTDLNVRLVEDADQIRIRIEADGTSRSRTVSTKGPVRFMSRDQAQFNAGKDLIVSPTGIFVSRAEAQARNQSELLNVESDYDQIPLLGWIVRQIAIDEHREHRPLVKNEVQRRVERRASSQLDRSIHDRLAGAETRIDETILEPLRQLELDPRAIEMRTTNQRAVMRLRLAGPEQLAAYTPRPRALSNNLLSMQLHESAANNLLDQLDLDDKAFKLENLIAELNQKLHVERQDLHEEIPEGVEIQLGSERPIQFEFADDRVLVSIKVKRLRTPRRLFRDFVVRGRYRADIAQTHVDLQRDGGIELISEQIGFRDQVALRGIFTKVMSRDHRFNIIQGRVKQNANLKKLGVTQFVVRDGWIGVSVGPMRNDRVARH